MRQVSTKYTVMKVRQKISFMAFQKNQTILEIWLKSILNCYKYVKMTKQIPPLACQEKLDLIYNINRGHVKLSLLSLAQYRINIENHNHDEFGKCEKDKSTIQLIPLKKKKKGSGDDSFHCYADTDVGHDVVHHLKNILDKTKCYDIFQGTKVKNMPMYHRRTIKDVMFYSVNMKKLNKKLRRIQVVK